MKAVINRAAVSPEHRAVATGTVSPCRHGMLSSVSIVIPVAPDDDSWRPLIRDLVESRTAAEVILVGTHAEPAGRCQMRMDGAQADVTWTATTPGRAHQMNCGATLATRPFLWFLHADSRVGVNALLALERSLEADPHSLHYFDLWFQDDGPGLVRLNGFGVRVRSRYLSLPFGDQGLCMSRDTFQRLGEFDEVAAYGEDHLLVWAAHRHRVPLRRVGAFITTSARKYRTNGWFATTLVHCWRTWRQALPQFVRLFWSRLR